MARPRKNPTPEQARLVTINQIATALGWTRSQTMRRLNKTAYVTNNYQRHRISWDGSVIHYDKDVIEILRGLYGQPRRPVGRESDWLNDYERSNSAITS